MTKPTTLKCLDRSSIYPQITKYNFSNDGFYCHSSIVCISSAWVGPDMVAHENPFPNSASNRHRAQQWRKPVAAISTPFSDWFPRLSRDCETLSHTQITEPPPLFRKLQQQQCGTSHLLTWSVAPMHHSIDNIVWKVYKSKDIDFKSLPAVFKTLQ